MILKTQLGHVIEVESSHSDRHVMIDLGGNYEWKALTKHDARELAAALLAVAGPQEGDADGAAA